MASRELNYALISGAASGMGRIYARRLAEMGYGIVLVDINGQLLESLEEEIKSLRQDCRIVRIVQDLSKSDAAQNIYSRLEGIAVDILINNAGMIFTSTIPQTPPEKLNAMLTLHCNTPLLLCRMFVPGMLERGCGYVLNISSICAAMHWPAIGMYGNTKAFVKNYSRSLRIETRGSGVSVSTVSFGAVDTPLFGFSEKIRKLMLKTGIMISPEKAVDIALKAMFKRKKNLTPGFLNKVTLLIAPLLSERFLAFLLKKYGHLLH